MFWKKFVFSPFALGFHFNFIIILFFIHVCLGFFIQFLHWFSTLYCLRYLSGLNCATPLWQFWNFVCLFFSSSARSFRNDPVKTNFHLHASSPFLEENTRKSFSTQLMAEKEIKSLVGNVKLNKNKIRSEKVINWKTLRSFTNLRLFFYLFSSSSSSFWFGWILKVKVLPTACFQSFTFKIKMMNRAWNKIRNQFMKTTSIADRIS